MWSPKGGGAMIASLISRAQQRMTNLLYRHGLFCASHPLLILYICFLFIMSLSYPAVLSIDATLRRPRGFEPAQYWERGTGLSSVENDLFMDTFKEGPFIQLQQVFIATSSAQPGVLDKQFLYNLHGLQQALQSYAVPSPRTGKPVTLNDICFSVPDGRCVIHSPLEFWNGDSWRLIADENIRSTVASRHLVSSLGVRMALPLVFGGISYNDNAERLPTGATSVAVTVLFDAADAGTIQDISAFWTGFWQEMCDGNSQRSIGKIFGAADAMCGKEGHTRRYFITFNASGYERFAEGILLLSSYFLVFIYLSLSLGRVELVKSKFGLGFSAVMLVVFSFTMSFGVCSLIGFELTFVPWEILPFMVMAVGMENTLMLTNAVVSTSLDLPVKQRIGLGLSRFGSTMARSLAAELVILSMGILFRIPVLVEFCIFAAVAVTMDAILHMTFFVTVLSIDIRRLELTDLHDHRVVSFLRSTAEANEVHVTENQMGDSQGAGAWRRRMFRIGGISLVLIAIILISFYGSVDESASADTSFSRVGPFNRNASAAAVDDFWSVVNPSLSDSYLEMPPAFVVTLSSIPSGSSSFTRRPRPSASPPISSSSDSSSTPSDSSSTPSDSSSAPSDSSSSSSDSTDSSSPSPSAVSSVDGSLLAYIADSGPILVLFTLVVIAGCVAASAVLLGVFEIQKILAWVHPTPALPLKPEWLDGPVRQIALRGRRGGDVEGYDVTPSILVTASLDRTLSVWDRDTGECHVTVATPTSAPAWHVVADANWFACGCADGTVAVWQMAGESGEEGGEVSGGDRRGGVKQPPMKVTRVFCASPSDEEEASDSAHCGAVTGIALDANANLIVSASMDRTVRVARVDSGECVAILVHRAPVTRLVKPRGINTVITGAADGSLRVFDISAALGQQQGSARPSRRTASSSSIQEAEPVIHLQGHVTSITALAVGLEPAAGSSPSLRWLASGSEDGQIRIWDCRSGACVVALGGHAGAVRQLALDASTGTLVSAGQDEQVVLWDLATQRAVRHIECPGCAAFDIVDHVIVTAYGTGYRVHDLVRGGLLGHVAVRPQAGEAGRLSALLVSADEVGELVTNIVGSNGTIISDHGDAVIVTHISAARSSIQRAATKIIA